MSDCIIKLEHLKKAYDNSTPLADVSVEINRGDVISIIGPSGTGKSTLLRCINGLNQVTSGHVYINGQDITSPKCDLSKIRLKVGMVFQSFNLFDNLNVEDNISNPQVKLLGRSREEANKRTRELLAQLGMEGREKQFPDMLSGGQKQRVAIARAMAMDPEILLFDEPTSALDPTRVGEVQAIIGSLAKSGMTILIVTHEMQFARTVANRVFYMDEGGIYEDGTPEQIFDNPKREKTRRFVKRLQSIELDVESTEFELAEFMDKLVLFGTNTMLNKMTLLHLQVVFEELVMVQLVHERAQFSPVHVLVQYSGTEQWVELTAQYDGEKYNPLDNTERDEVLHGLVTHVVKSHDHEYAYGINKLTVRI